MDITYDQKPGGILFTKAQRKLEVSEQQIKVTYPTGGIIETWKKSDITITKLWKWPALKVELKHGDPVFIGATSVKTNLLQTGASFLIFLFLMMALLQINSQFTHKFSFWLAYVPLLLVPITLTYWRFYRLANRLAEFGYKIR